MDDPIVFAHERLDAYRLAHEFVAGAARLIAGMPRGEHALADQLRRAADSALLNLSEGAARTAARDKAHFYDIARGSAVECAAILDAFGIRALAPAGEIDRVRTTLYRTVCLLGGLARSARGRRRPDRVAAGAARLRESLH